MDINKYAARKLKELRVQKNLTQEKLAEELNITQQQIARYENNMRQFKQDFLYQLAEYFGVSINYFFPQVNHLNNDNELLEQISNLSDEKKKMLKDFLNLIDKEGKK
jgi:transcriptional regulator with XRE-family HTH domain|nr:MAG TPA: Helix-turn-helix XRE-family like protein [Caudoviricetes sp.]